jgi:hypothetical protein
MLNKQGVPRKRVGLSAVSFAALAGKRMPLQSLTQNSNNTTYVSTETM